jgi:hypothetical protein
MGFSFSGRLPRLWVFGIAALFGIGMLPFITGIACRSSGKTISCPLIAFHFCIAPLSGRGGIVGCLDLIHDKDKGSGQSLSPIVLAPGKWNDSKNRRPKIVAGIRDFVPNGGFIFT